MKSKNAAVLVAVGLGMAASLFAAEKMAANAEPKVIWLKSHGERVAELKIFQASDKVEVTTNQSSYNAAGRLVAWSGDASIKIKVTGGSPIIVKADEVEARFLAK